jgi:polyisoprenoid-binding protein YceI
MPSFDAQNAECLVFTFKDGLLSPVAHDLRLRVTCFSIEVAASADSVTATFDASSLVVDVPMKDGAENPSALSAADKHKTAQIRDDVLETRKYPEIAFRSRSLRKRDDGGYDFTGELSLHGVTRLLGGATQLVGGRQRLELTLHQPISASRPTRRCSGR